MRLLRRRWLANVIGLGAIIRWYGFGQQPLATTGVAAGSAAAPHSADPRLRRSYLMQFQLGESPAEVHRLMGPPTQVADLGAGYQTWLYQVHVHDKHEFSHTFCFRMPERKLISILRQMEIEESVDSLFPHQETTVHAWPNATEARYSARVRQLGTDRYLVAMGSGRIGQPCAQLYLLGPQALQVFHPWLWQGLRSKTAVSAARPAL